jgi:hypothetical protein
MGYASKGQAAFKRGGGDEKALRGWKKVFAGIGIGKWHTRTKREVYVTDDQKQEHNKNALTEKRLYERKRDLKDEEADIEHIKRYAESHDKLVVRIDNRAKKGEITKPHVSSQTCNEILHKRRNSVGFQRKNNKASIMQAAMKSGDPEGYMKARGLAKLAKRGKAAKFFAKFGGSEEVGLQWGTIQKELKKIGIKTTPEDLALGNKAAYAPNTMVSLLQFLNFVEKSKAQAAPAAPLAPIKIPGQRGRRDSVLNAVRRRLSVVSR